MLIAVENGSAMRGRRYVQYDAECNMFLTIVNGIAMRGTSYVEDDINAISLMFIKQ